MAPLGSSALHLVPPRRHRTTARTTARRGTRPATSDPAPPSPAHRRRDHGPPRPPRGAHATAVHAMYRRRTPSRDPGTPHHPTPGAPMPPAPPPQSPPPAYQALCSHTHLFPGARCRLQGLPHPEAFAADPEPIDVHLRFSDGTAAPADLRTDPATLTVAAHTTAGHPARRKRLGRQGIHARRGRGGDDHRRPRPVTPARRGRIGRRAHRDPARDESPSGTGENTMRNEARGTKPSTTAYSATRPSGRRPGGAPGAVRPCRSAAPWAVSRPRGPARGSTRASPAHVPPDRGAPSPVASFPW